MNDEHRCGPEGCEAVRLLRADFDKHHEDYEDIKAKVEKHEKTIAKHDTSFAVINTKLSAILWGLAVIGAAVIGYIVDRVFM